MHSVRFCYRCYIYRCYNDSREILAVPIIRWIILQIKEEKINSNWTISDLIDLEYFLGAGSENDGEDPGFDRSVYLSYADEQGETPRDDARGRRDLIRYWLEKRRKREQAAQTGGAPLPGAAFSEAVRIAKILLAALAMIFGAGLAWSLLSYTGREPVNVFTFLWVLVVPQVGLLLLLVLSVAVQKAGAGKAPGLVYPVLAGGIRALLQKTGRLAEKKLDTQKKNRIREVYFLLGKTRTVYGSVFFWPVFIAAQIAGVAFNAGAAGALLIKVTITDLAFGWQTTLRLVPESVHRIVEIIALPWSWLLSPPTAHPGLEQIAGSQMILKDGMLHLATTDLVAWWPFLLLAILCYGLFPRLLLTAGGILMKRRALTGLGFNHAVCDRLIMQMKTPRLDTGGTPYQPAGIRPEASETGELIPDTLGGAAGDTMPAIVVFPEEIADIAGIGAGEPPEDLETALRKYLGVHCVAFIAGEMDAREDSRRVREALEHAPEKTSPRIVIIQEAWQPPIRETLSWIRSIRGAAGKSAGMIIALVGKPAANTFFTHPSETDGNTWEKTIHRMDDPYIRTEMLGEDPR